jgi:putative hemolysin
MPERNRLMENSPRFTVRLAASADDIRAAQALRYEVFVVELGGNGAMVDHDARLEKDHYDPFFEHLMLFDAETCVGVYRLLSSDAMPEIGRYYSEDEFDLGPLKASDRRLLELGRSCVHKSYRGGAALMHLWQGLSAYITQNKIDILFGVASFHGTDVNALAQPLSHLHHNFLAPAELRVTATGETAVAMDQLSGAQTDARRALLEMPQLIKAYLRMGGMVGQGAWVDHSFNTVDVCMVLDMARINQKQAALYQRAPR